MNTFEATAITNKNGELGFHNIDQINDFCKKFPNSTLTVQITANPTKSRESLINYYYGVVIPKWQQAKAKSQDNTDKDSIDSYLRSLYTPLTRNKSLSTLSLNELREFLGIVKIKTMVEINEFIEHPACL